MADPYATQDRAAVNERQRITRAVLDLHDGYTDSVPLSGVLAAIWPGQEDEAELVVCPRDGKTCECREVCDV